jgi:hypothetical protein
MPGTAQLTTALALGSALLLSACGGGGGSAGSGSGGVGTPPTATTFNFDNAAERVLTLGTSLGATATANNGSTISLQYSVTPQADANFENVLRKRSVERVRLVQSNGTVLADESATQFFSTGPLRFFGGTDSEGYTVTTSTGNLPTAGTVGQSGALFTSITYADAAKASVVSRAEARWSLEAGPGSSTAYACLNFSYFTAANAPDGNAAQCYLTDTTGNVTGLRVTLTVGGQTVVFR